MNEIRKLSELAMHLKQVADMYCQHDYEQQIMEAVMNRHSGWIIVEGNAACMMYLYRNWVFAEKAEENAAQMKALVDGLIENYEECEEEFLTAELATEAMDIADRVYDFSHRVLKNQHLFIFLFQTRHKKEDSFCRCMNMSDGSMVADIYMLVPHKDLEATPQSMFLHELGQCVNITLTGMNQDNCGVSEFFAHCFAMSLLYESELLNADPFKMVPQNHKRVFQTYFKAKL